MSDHASWPSVGVVVPTRRRPEQLRRALVSILSQDYTGPMTLVVVFDGTEPDASLTDANVRAIPNSRTPGLAGARNTGILALDTDLVAFCDDDDEWLPTKLQTQVELLRRSGADFVASGVVFAYGDSATARVAGTVVTHDQLLRSRMAMLHSSTFVIRRVALLHQIGLVDETIPGGQGEDWDLLLRASETAPIRCANLPLVRVSWSRDSYFGRRWDTKVASLRWMLEHHRGLVGDRRAAARLYGQLAFAHAARGSRAEALFWSGKAFARRPLEPRTYLAVAVVARITSADAVLDWLHRRGHGV